MATSNPPAISTILTDVIILRRPPRGRLRDGGAVRPPGPTRHLRRLDEATRQAWRPEQGPARHQRPGAVRRPEVIRGLLLTPSPDPLSPGEGVPVRLRI